MWSRSAAVRIAETASARGEWVCVSDCTLSV